MQVTIDLLTSAAFLDCMLSGPLEIIEFLGEVGEDGERTLIRKTRIMKRLTRHGNTKFPQISNGSNESLK